MKKLSMTKESLKNSKLTKHKDLEMSEYKKLKVDLSAKKDGVEIVDYVQYNKEKNKQNMFAIILMLYVAIAFFIFGCCICI